MSVFLSLTCPPVSCASIWPQNELQWEDVVQVSLPGEMTEGVEGTRNNVISQSYLHTHTHTHTVVYLTHVGISGCIVLHVTSEENESQGSLSITK